jgi:hypothetical protein
MPQYWLIIAYAIFIFIDFLSFRCFLSFFFFLHHYYYFHCIELAFAFIISFSSVLLITPFSLRYAAITFLLDTPFSLHY